VPGVLGGEQQRRHTADRLPDDDRRFEAQCSHDERGVRDVRLPGDVVGEAFAASVTACVERDDASAIAQRRRRCVPFAAVTGQSVEQQDRRSRPTEVAHGEPDSVAL
jgi:hypothetical protein